MGRKLHKSPKGSTVSFHNISYEVNVRKFPWSCPNRISVLSNLSGILTPGMNAIMGPTGCGKSSLLDVLAGRKNPQNVSGYVLLDGERQPVQVHRQVCGYVVQDNIAVNALTVRENIAFSATLRLPSRMSSKDREARVDSVIEELDLTAVADRLLGTEYVRGVSGGERKRTCIGIELIKDPSVLYLDEPTTGLDAYTAGSVMKTLKRLASAGRTIVFSIHQPKYSIYRLFDRLTLIANGQMIYHGPAGRDPIDYLGQFGYVLEGYNNPADFLLDTLHGEVPITEYSAEECAENEDLTDPEVDMLLLHRSAKHSGDVPDSPCAVQRLLGLWQQSELFDSCQRTVNAIARAYEARHVRSRSPSPSAAGSSIPSGRSRLGDCRVQSAPVCRLLPNRLNVHGLVLHPTKQTDWGGSDISLRQPMSHTASDSDANVLNPIDCSPNQSDSTQLDQRSSERLLAEPTDLSSCTDSGKQLANDRSCRAATQSATDRPHFFPFYRFRSEQPQRSSPGSEVGHTKIARSLTQPTPVYTRIESGSPSPSSNVRHSLTNPAVYEEYHETTNVGFTVSTETAGSSSSIAAIPFRKRNPVGRLSGGSAQPHHAKSPVRTSSKQLSRTACCGDSPYAASYCQQLIALSGRQWLSMIRDYKSLMSHFIIQFIIAVFLGIIYFDLDQSIESGIQNRTGLFFFTCIQLLFINSSMIDAFLRDRLIFKHETSSGFYRVSAYFFAKILTEVLPVKALPALVFLPITYLMAGLRSTLRAFLFWELTLTLLTITASGVAFSVSAMVTDFRVGSMLLSMFFVLMMITSGFLINVLSMGCWFSWLRYLSFLRFAINSLIINEMSGMQFCSRETYANRSNPFPVDNGTVNRPKANLSLLSMREFTITDWTSSNCITGEQYMETQAIEFDSDWAVWQNEFGIFGIFILALINAYIYLRLMKKYK